LAKAEALAAMQPTCLREAASAEAGEPVPKGRKKDELGAGGMEEGEY
jgi:hypothetical protein